jgi:hypothetical protein
MEKINELFECAIGDANAVSIPSLYTKDDVVKLLTNLRDNVALLPTPTATISEMDFQEFSANVSKRLDRALNDGTIDPIDIDSAEFNIGYHNTIELERVNVDTENITEELANILLDEFQNAFAKFLTKDTE